jgi:hypothetical protein
MSLRCGAAWSHTISERLCRHRWLTPLLLLLLTPLPTGASRTSDYKGPEGSGKKFEKAKRDLLDQ